MNKRNLCLRHASANQLRANILIHVKCSVMLRRREIAKQKLCQPVCFSILINAKNVSYTGIELAIRVIRQQRIHQPLIKPQLSAIRSNFKHIVY